MTMKMAHDLNTLYRPTGSFSNFAEHVNKRCKEFLHDCETDEVSLNDL